MSRALVHHRPLRPISTGGRWSYRTIRRIGILVVRPLWGLRVEGLERLPVGVAYVVAPVHRSYVDFAVMVAVIPRVMRFMAKDTVWRWRWLGRFIEFNGSFPVDREHADRDALRRCEQAVQGGDPVVMFPEGRRKEGPAVDELFDGPSFVACRNRVPIVPVGIGGSERAMPRGAKMIHRARIKVVIGEPIYPDVAATGRVPRRAITENTELLRSELQSLYDTVR
ncbi:MAG: 1-acyl-sn-glycerol-3-phosphate acyltransferase [Actinobacteria bacterium]|nr:1-acyl-sn-glycerol-3-phosphate acyltransferase [Actinomycetota bacterium]